MEWRAIPEFEGAYEAGDDGTVRRIGAGRGVVAGRIITPSRMPAGYLMYSLWSGNVQHMRLGHRLVASAFNGPCPPGHEVNHKNSTKADNRPVNLEYVTRSENMMHRSALGIGRGESNGMSKLNEAKVLEIRRRHRDGEGYKNLGKAYGVSWEAIRNIIKRRVWAWVAE